MNEISKTLIDLALEEDLGPLGDLTSRYFVHSEHRSRGLIVSRETAIVSGLEVAKEVCRRVDSNLEFAIHFED